MLNRRTIKLAIAILFLLPKMSTAQASVKEQLNIALSKPGKPFNLEAKLEKGIIKIITYPGTDIQIETEALAEKIEKAKPDQNQNQNQNTNTNTNVNIDVAKSKKDNNTARSKYISVTENNNLVIIKPILRSKVLSMVIRLPQNNVGLNLVIEKDGDILVSGITGKIEATNNTGSISLINISGSALASTITGAIIATFRSVTEKSPMAFSTLIGNLDITLPASLKANVKLKTGNGEIFTDFDIIENAAKPAAKPYPVPNPKAKQAGEARFKLNNTDWVYGKINRGGLELMLQNMQGNIYIRKPK